MQLHKEYHAEQNKENQPASPQRDRRRHPPRAFIDPQPDAERIHFSDESPPPEEQPASPRPMTSQTRDGTDDEVPDPSSDEGFQQDIPLVPPGISPTKILKRSAATTLHSSPKRVRVAVGDEESAQEPERVAPSTDDSNPPSALQLYKEVNQAARSMTNALRPKLPQQRVPWSEEEIDRLIELIEEHGTSWSRLKKIDEKSGHILANRDQVALKDKARNMKFDFMK
jgi:hypothetical protein